MAMITPEKIEEWMKEAEERPASMGVILKYLANRVRDLTGRSEELRAENLALRTDKKVEEYEQRIANLEYQLQILRRQVGGELPASLPEIPADGLSLVAYDTHGRLLRVTADPTALLEGARLAQLAHAPGSGAEAPRLLVLPSSEELLFVFSSGRIDTQSVAGLASSGQPDWQQADQPHEPRGGETLACVAPIARLAMAEMIVQASRRGFAKKLMTSLAASVMNKRYIGTGATIVGDRTHTLALAGKDDRLVLVSREGYLLALAVHDLPFSAEEAFRLGPTDLLAAGFVCLPGRSIVVMTQAGKLVHWTEDRLEVVHAVKARGQALFSAQRRERGVRVVGAGAVLAEDWAAALHADGSLTVHSVRSLIEQGAIPVNGELVDFVTFTLPGKK